jgi:hypothetical protein
MLGGNDGEKEKIILTEKEEIPQHDDVDSQEPEEGPQQPVHVRVNWMDGNSADLGTSLTSQTSVSELRDALAQRIGAEAAWSCELFLLGTETPLNNRRELGTLLPEEDRGKEGKSLLLF